jgi:hypothetical protein
VDQKETRYIDASGSDLPYGRQLLHDIIHRTETAMTQAHCFLACELALQAQAQAKRLGDAYTFTRYQQALHPYHYDPAMAY